MSAEYPKIGHNSFLPIHSYQITVSLSDEDKYRIIIIYSSGFRTGELTLYSESMWFESGLEVRLA